MRLPHNLLWSTEWRFYDSVIAIPDSLGSPLNCFETDKQLGDFVIDFPVAASSS
jgi:hypothetical protein